MWNCATFLDSQITCYKLNLTIFEYYLDNTNIENYVTKPEEYAGTMSGKLKQKDSYLTWTIIIFQFWILPPAPNVLFRR